jgi:hypothetical protein
MADVVDSDSKFNYYGLVSNINFQKNKMLELQLGHLNKK